MPASPIDPLLRPLGVAIHDAGAANMVIGWCAAAERLPERVWAQGPARALWQARFGDGAFVEGPDALLDDAGCLLSGTGWASDLEHRARLGAAQRGIRSIAVIDHWVNYAMRFERDGNTQLPDAIWVGDEYAAAIARDAFAGVPVELHANLYLAEQAAGAGPPPADGDILFVAEPARSDWGADRAGEFQALDYFIAHRGAAGIAPDAQLRLRPHPSDPAGKYDDWLAGHPGTALDTSPDMAAALGAARWVVGMNSVALVVALEAGRTAISALPANAPPCTLPHVGIRRL